MNVFLLVLAFCWGFAEAVNAEDFLLKSKLRRGSRKGKKDTTEAPTIPPSQAPVREPTVSPVDPTTHEPTFSPVNTELVDPTPEDGCPEIPPNGCPVCGEGKCITKPDALFVPPPPYKTVSCSALQNSGINGIVPMDDCPFMPLLINDACGCSPGGDPTKITDVTATDSPTLTPILVQTLAPTLKPTLDPTAAPSMSLSSVCPEIPPNGCSVCGKGKCITKPACHLLQSSGMMGTIPIGECSLLPELIKDVCGCSPGGDLTIITDAGSINNPTTNLL